jgi:hypothetical protein
MDRTTSPNDLQNVLLNHLPGFKIRSMPNRDRADIELTGQHESLFVYVKVCSKLRLKELYGQLAVGVLEGRTQKIDGREGIPLVLVQVPSIGEKSLHQAEDFMNSNARDVAWGIADNSGLRRLVIPAMGVNVTRHEAMPNVGPRFQSRNLFTDLNRWMLKILTMADVDPRYWGGPREQIRSATHLHRVARVSIQKAHDFVNALSAEGFLRKSRTAISVNRRRELAEALIQSERTTLQERVPVRWILGEIETVDDLFENSPANHRDFALGGFCACKRLGVLHATAYRTDIHLGADLLTALRNWHLETCDERDAHLFLTPSKYWESIRRGCVVREGLPTADVLQAALDVATMRGRGAEQAHYILDHVLRWRDD